MNTEIELITVYLSVSAKVKETSVKSELTKIIENKDSAVLMIGDVNGHLGFLGDQPVNDNG
ncbi:hypothetical protein E2C01_058686 [Portunus trituberculatus]|uniref:Craniofacial development protein 2 n=1 Tax=Portunus trituberculatus TaxID=210409 RepID=A0A5B7H644_PORTR|nr:hypothetical protein [Portunus trituberculatus]